MAATPPTATAPPPSTGRRPSQDRTTSRKPTRCPLSTAASRSPRTGLSAGKEVQVPRLMSARWRHEHRRAFRAMAGAGISVAMIAGFGTAAVAAGVISGFGDSQVGTSNADGILLPTNQRIKPIGSRLLVDNGRLLSSSTSPDGQYLAALTWNDFTGFLTIFNLKTGAIVQQLY